MINNIVLVGRLTKDPEIRETESNVKVTNITLAVDRPYKDKDDEQSTDFIPVTLWKTIAENTVKYCHKGDLVGVKGHIQDNNYTDKDGNKKYGLEIVVEKITFLATKKESQ